MKIGFKVSSTITVFFSKSSGFHTEMKQSEVPLSSAEGISAHWKMKMRMFLAVRRFGGRIAQDAYFLRKFSFFADGPYMYMRIYSIPAS